MITPGEGHETGMLVDPLEDFEASPIQKDRDGGISADYLDSEKIPDATPENFLCLRGPCKFYLELTMPAEVDQRAALDGMLIVQTNRFCHAIPGDAIDLTERTVLSCNAWDPDDGNSHIARESRRAAYLKKHPSERK